MSKANATTFDASGATEQAEPGGASLLNAGPSSQVFFILEGASARGDHWSHISDHETLAALKERYRKAHDFEWPGRPLRAVKHEVTVIASNLLQAWPLTVKCVCGKEVSVDVARHYNAVPHCPECWRTAGKG